MDNILLIIGLILALLGVFSSFIPILPDTPLSWTALFLLHFTKAVPDNWWFLGITGAITLFVCVMDYAIPAMGAKKFGGTKAGMIGATIGLIIGILSPIPGGLIIGTFLGAYIGEFSNKTGNKIALKAAFGTFIGLLTGTFMKFIITVIFLGLFLMIVWDHKETLFP